MTVDSGFTGWWAGRERGQGSDAATLSRHFGSSDRLLPLWIAEPSIDLCPEVNAAIQARAQAGWFGYEVRPDSIIDAFWAWMSTRHRWNGQRLHTSVSPSVGTSIGVLIDEVTNPGDGVIVQPPVFTDFKPLISAGRRVAARSPLVLTGDGYRIDFDHLAAKASDPANRMLILCSPHNPVGRVWTREELRTVAAICTENDVFVLADEIHADLAIPPHEFVPFAMAAAGSGVRWAATHGPIKTFGLAGVCDTLLVTDCDDLTERYRSRSSQFHLTRNNVFGLAAFEAAYLFGGSWLDGLLGLIASNVDVLQEHLPDEIKMSELQGTYLAWLDLRGLGLEVSDIAAWLASSAGLALSPGHWFGREGAGFARMSIAARGETIERAVDQLAAATRRLSAP